MYIDFRTNKLKNKCEDFEIAKKELGEPCGKKLTQRLQEIQATPNLEELHKLPSARCHQLKGKKAGQYAVDLEHPKRLIFKPLGEDEEIKPGGVLILKEVKGVIILEIVDYH